VRRFTSLASRIRRSWLSVLLLGVLLGGILAAAPFLSGLAGVRGGAGRALESPLTPALALAQESKVGGAVFSVADVAERALPSVVNISSTRKTQAVQSPFEADPFFREFFHNFGGGPSMPAPRAEKSLGSGVIVSADGVVVTNSHVVEKADRIRVALSDKKEYDAKLVGADPKSDIAVLKLVGAKGLQPIKLGDSDRLRLGDSVLAIGNPFGVGQTVTMGIVSAKGRANMGIVDYEDFIQTDAAINPGNSGGALVNMRGELVGVNTAILSRTGGYQGIGFAIPSNMVGPILKSLLKSGKVVRGWLGVVIQEVDGDLATAMKLPTSKGVLVSDVEPNAPAARAGLKRGDLIVAINGRPVDSTGQLRTLVASSGVGNKVQVEFLRDGKRLSQQVVLAELPAGATAALSTQGTDGLTIAPLDAATRSRFNIPSRVGFGVVVTAVTPDSSAAQAGLQQGDVILEVNRGRMNSVRAFFQAYGAAQGRVLLLVYRQGNTAYMLMTK
jgi:serine protease Do